MSGLPDMRKEAPRQRGIGRRTRRRSNNTGGEARLFATKSRLSEATCGAANIASNLPRNFLIFRKAKQASNAFA
jgi:hypothetical protein